MSVRGFGLHPATHEHPRHSLAPRRHAMQIIAHPAVASEASHCFYLLFLFVLSLRRNVSEPLQSQILACQGLMGQLQASARVTSPFTGISSIHGAKVPSSHCTSLVIDNCCNAIRLTA